MEHCERSIVSDTWVLWTLCHLLEVLDSFVGSNPYQQQMLVQSWGTSLSVSAHTVSCQIDILYHSPQWSAPLPHIPRNTCHHHRKHKWGSLLIPCRPFRMKVKVGGHWGVVCGFDLCLFGSRRCLPKHDIRIVDCVKRGSKEDCKDENVVLGVVQCGVSDHARIEKGNCSVSCSW